MGSFKFATTPGCMNITVEGQFSPADATAYAEKFQSEAKKITPSSCVIDFDATKLQVSASDSAKILQQIVQMYKDLGFDSIVLRIGGNAMVKMQCKMIIEKVGFKKFEIL